MTFIFRIAKEEDIHHLVRLRIEFLKEIQIDAPERDMLIFKEKLTDYFLRNMRNGTFLAWFAEADGEVIATSGLAIIERPPQLWNINGKEGYIMNMYTKPSWRRKGIGSALLDKLMDEIKKRDVILATLHATPDGRPLYEKYGFVHGHHEMYKRCNPEPSVDQLQVLLIL